jgi:transmembrane sensor
MNENDFTAADFLADGYFREWILSPNKENRLYWENWAEAHPGLQAELDLARQLMVEIQITQHTLSQNKADKIWAAIEAEVAAAEAGPVSGEEAAQNQPKAPDPACLALAGSVLLGLSLACLGLAIFLNKSRHLC